MKKTKRSDQTYQISDVLQVVGINSQGFGIYPKLVARDISLTIEAKAIYAYFVSFAGAGTTAFPKVDTICHDLSISKDRYYRHFKLLQAGGYVTADQKKVAGKFSHNVYTLMTDIINPKDPQDLQPCPQNKDTVKSAPCPCFEDTQNKDSNSNSIKNNNTKILSFLPEEGKKEKEKKVFEKKQKVGNSEPAVFIDKELDDMAIKMIYEQCELDWLDLDKDYPGMDDAVRDAISDMYNSVDGIVVKQTRKAQDIVRSVLMKMTADSVRYAVDAIKLVAQRGITEVRNPKKYLMAALYDAQVESSVRGLIDYNRDSADA